ncbi:MAG TPA: hypothetical protein VHF69_12295, partial [Candidatus Synoicihabitans sp.]|nr:hypothetical protein [Candidatus Synoicihabitans sp.]
VNQDGRIDAADTGGGYRADWPAVQTLHAASFSPVDIDASLGTGSLLGRVVFYSAGAGRSANDLILSWR